MIRVFHDFEVQQIPNDMLAKVVTTIPMALPRGVYFESIKKPAIKEMAKIMQLDDKPCWIDLLVHFLENGRLLAD